MKSIMIIIGIILAILAIVISARAGSITFSIQIGPEFGYKAIAVLKVIFAILIAGFVLTLLKLWWDIHNIIKQSKIDIKRAQSDSEYNQELDNEDDPERRSQTQNPRIS